jgi:hypothetical protein
VKPVKDKKATSSFFIIPYNEHSMKNSYGKKEDVSRKALI